MRIIYSMAILVVLAIPSFMANSSVSEIVVLPAVVLKDNICWSRFQICTAKIACICLESITLVLVTIIRVEEKKEISRQRQSRDYR